MISAVSTDDCSPTRLLRARRLGGALVGSLLLVVACTGGGAEGPSDTADDRPDGPNPGAPPTIEGGVELAAIDPAAVLVGEGLAFGEPLPSEQAAAELFTEDPEVASVLARRVFGQASGRLVGNVIVLVLDGTEIFDEGVLDAFVRGVVGAFGDGNVETVELGDQITHRSLGPAVAAHGFRDGNLLVVVTALAEADAAVVVEHQVAARAAGVVGTLDPATPMHPLPIDAAFIAVPTVTFQPIPPPEEEVPPATPGLPGATGVQGRYGVVAGERRTVIWSYTLFPATYPSAEALGPAMAALVSARAGGSPSKITEVLDRIVFVANAAPGVDEALNARAFRHGALVLLVEGADPAQVDAVVSDWISALI